MALSVTEAALEGFHLLGRRPLSFLAWTLAWIVLVYGVLGLILWQAWPGISQLLQGLPAASSDPRTAFAAMAHVQLGFLSLFGPIGLWAWIVSVVLLAAVYRSVLEPRNRGLAYLRLGGDELRLLGLSVIYLVLRIAYLVAAVIACAVVFVAARQLVQPWEGLVDVAAVLAAIVLGVWLSVRLVLAAPMTFARKRLQIFDSWRLTRGRGWSLVGLCLLLLIFIIALAFVLAMVRNLLTLGLLPNMMSDLTVIPADPHARLARMLQQLPALFESPLMIAMLAIQGLGDMLLRVVAAAPFAEVYRQLSGPPAASAAGALDAAPSVGPAPAPHPAG